MTRMMRPAPDMIGPSWLPLADAIRKRGLLRHNVDAADNPVGRGSKLTHFTAPHFAIHLIETRANWLIEIGIARCLRQRDCFERSGNVVVNLHWEEGPHGHSH